MASSSYSRIQVQDDASPASAQSPSPSSPSSPLDNKLILQEDIVEETAKLGRGGFGFVRRGTYRGLAVVCKHFHPRNNEAAVIETYNRELMVLELDLKHQHVVTLLGATATLGWEPNACIVMEDAGSETLQSYVEDRRNLMTLDHSVFFLDHILAGVRYLHSKNVVHLDLKPANFTLNRQDPENPVVRLCDFGTVHVVGQSWESQLQGTVAFRAPELFCGGTPTFSSDLYSLAVVMWFFDTRECPWEGVSHFAIIYQCVQKQLRPSVPSCDSALLQRYRNLYGKCWAHSCNERPTLEEVTEVIQQISHDLEG